MRAASLTLGLGCWFVALAGLTAAGCAGGNPAVVGVTLGDDARATPPPGAVVPSSVDPALAIKLDPGDGLVQNFDPRLYCLGKTPVPLVEGAQVSPRFGWPPKMKVSWRGGKREETPAVQNEPFVGEPSE